MTTTEKTMTSPFSMKPEYIEEIEVDEQTRIKHKAACVWKLLGISNTQVKLERYCSLYQ